MAVAIEKVSIIRGPLWIAMSLKYGISKLNRCESEKMHDS